MGDTVNLTLSVSCECTKACVASAKVYIFQVFVMTVCEPEWLYWPLRDFAHTVQRATNFTAVGYEQVSGLVLIKCEILCSLTISHVYLQGMFTWAPGYVLNWESKLVKILNIGGGGVL